MTARISRDAYGLEVAAAVARRADCTRRQVGAVIVSPDGSIVATGYNGLSAGLPGCASAGACPRGRMAYPSEPPVKVGDPDTTPFGWGNERNVGDRWCGRQSAVDDDGSAWTCTREERHDGWHIAGDGVEVCHVWTDAVAHPASVGYEATGCRAAHAEVNAVIRAGRDRCIGATIYVTDEPCFHCSVVIEAAGITRVVTPGTTVVRPGDEERAAQVLRDRREPGDPPWTAAELLDDPADVQRSCLELPSFPALPR